MTEFSTHRFCTAPLMDWSDRHCRFFWRLLSRRARLYTEMVTTGALEHGDRARFLAYSSQELPLALQLGGSEPDALGRCARWAEDAGFSEVNLNCGCPSDRVQKGSFGACLMAEPALVADCVRAMRDHCALPVTVKHRIGIDELDSYQALCDFVGTVAAAGCETFIVHARKAWLSGLSPKENREIPPLHYDRVYALKRDFPHLTLVLNGGIQSLMEAQQQLQWVDGVMLGRAAYQDPWLLQGVDPLLFGEEAPLRARKEVLDALCAYVERELRSGTRLAHMTRHLLGLYNGQPGARQFRRYLSEHAHRPEAGLDVLRAAFALPQRQAA
jgi:tRNA-dihydrouridine synthase A